MLGAPQQNFKLGVFTGTKPDVCRLMVSLWDNFVSLLQVFFDISTTVKFVKGFNLMCLNNMFKTK